MTASREMPKYQCHKKVWALKIKNLSQGVAPTELPGGSWLLHPEDKRYAAIEVSHEWFSKHKPVVGGYYVAYEDGYKSYSPAPAFEAGYSLLSCRSELSASAQADQRIEAELVAAGLDAPRVTADHIQALMDRVVYHYEQPQGTTSTFAHAFLDGFYLASGYSACVSVANFDAAKGQKYAKEQAEPKARDKLWELEGYVLHRDLARPALD